MIKHGWSKTNTYFIWTTMRQRCRNKKNRKWPMYGGRGITVCDRWNKFENFLADMGERPEGLSIERLDRKGPYAPGNCIWANALVQANNRGPRKTNCNSKSGIKSVHLERVGFRSTPTIEHRARDFGVFDDVRDAAEMSWLALISVGDVEGAEFLLRSLPTTYDAAHFAALVSPRNNQLAKPIREFVDLLQSQPLKKLEFEFPQEAISRSNVGQRIHAVAQRRGVKVHVRTKGHLLVAWVEPARRQA